MLEGIKSLVDKSNNELATVQGLNKKGDGGFQDSHVKKRRHDKLQTTPFNPSTSQVFKGKNAMQADRGVHSKVNPKVVSQTAGASQKTLSADMCTTAVQPTSLAREWPPELASGHPPQGKNPGSSGGIQNGVPHNDQGQDVDMTSS